MLKHIIRKEILGNLTSPKFVFSYILCTILILVSVYTGIANYRGELKEYHETLALNAAELESWTSWADETNAGTGTKGITITRPPQILSTIAIGVQDAVGRNAKVGTAVDAPDPKLIDSKYDSNPVFAIFGPLDLTLIVKIVLSLFAILFTFDAIAGEKERGTLKLTLSNPVPRDQLILGKAIGSFVSFLVPLAVPLLMGLILLNIFPDISLSGEDWVRIGLIFLCFLLYLSVFFNLGLLISSRSSRSAGSLFILLFIWVIFIFIIPKAAVMASKQIMPVPSIHNVNSEKVLLMEAVKRKEGMSGKVQLKKWRVANRPSFAKPGPTPEIIQEYKDLVESIQLVLITAINAKTMGLEADYQTKRRRQQMLAFNLSRISPSSAMTFSALRLAKTGIAERERFMNSIRTYKPVFARWYNTKKVQHTEMKWFEPQPPKPSFEDMPRHAFVPETLGDSLYSIRYDLTLLILLNIILFAGTFVSFLRYDVR